MKPIRPAFTLVELIVATIILGLLAVAVAMVLSQAVRARDRSASRADASTRATLAAGMIAQDAESALRDSELQHAKVALTPGPAGLLRTDALVVFSDLPRPIRPGSGEPEGGESEVQYRLGPGPDPSQPTSLWRRARPVPGDRVGSGGVARPVVDAVLELALQASDGTSWFDTWDSDSDGLPHALRITVTASDNAGQTRATVRRLVAIDRVPIPAVPATETETEPADQPAAGTGGTP